MTRDEFQKFSNLLLQISAVCINPNELTQEKTEFYYELLQDIPFDQIKQSATDYLRSEKKPFFPSPAILRGDTQEKAIEAYNIISETMFGFYAPELGPASFTAMHHRLEKLGHSTLSPLLQRWGVEILAGNNPSATRAQFLKAYTTETKTAEKKMLPSGKTQHISGLLNQITNRK